jgi:hypothetical protein
LDVHCSVFIATYVKELEIADWSLFNFLVVVCMHAVVTYSTEVVFFTTVRIQGLSAADMDTGAREGFSSVCADSMEGASTNDITITSVTNPVTTTSTSSSPVHGAAVADKSVDIAFSTSLILEDSLFPTPETLVGARQDELTDALSEYSTLTAFVNYCVAFGSVKVTSSTEILFNPPRYSENITVLFSSPAPTPAPVVKEKESDKEKTTAGMNQKQFTVIVVLAAVLGSFFCILFGLAVYYLGWKPRPRERAWNRAIAPPLYQPAHNPHLVALGAPKKTEKPTRVHVQKNRGGVAMSEVELSIAERNDDVEESL